MKKKIAILGSTGSIGTQALEVIEEHADKFQVEVLTANGNADLLIAQAIKFKPNVVVIADEAKYKKVEEALWEHDIKTYAGNDALAQVVEMDEIDVVLTALVGYAGLLPTINAIKAKKTIALANKETLVVAGELINKLAIENKVAILPVDSEHSAIFQCLVGEFQNKIEKIYLTASGGPFRGKKREELQHITKEQALKHPNWDMGAKITIDSATLMNKGLEVIEAKWLFNLKPEQIDVIVHPQSIVHSLVQFEDGSMKAQLGLPDMKHPIQYALSFPQRLSSKSPRFNFMDYPELTFEKPDTETFLNLQLAFNALEKGGNMACILNAANEVAVEAFLKDKIKFLDIAEINQKCMEQVTFIAQPTYEDYVATDKQTRAFAESLI
ncbi:MAG: 1-deoxy-D-xylulose-5-phosphate reductoisomerase [Flavobacteriales bacterium]|nr:1-deoxy-D-xylulose-5-phosphate reductoisomerase [Flavobacteriales bacterium]MCW8911715.1 1-deoxy-D-xylulose-5-phosphate reductoisomerase [Flavobacteriales bacterium]MCW8936974.1 1-deoxy-D-xylulose-5-phosphate reductoisomerase [Flavobacteriales bacterium]MCW8968760.1 1-deoxy-D-xylulose-5-phosphate reductoisomerase [Flavobacteriales bacterium]MCW8989820.1 1-deoxy-D-xylulose-5-phosphate reductoisomerase [Flavobacteriales bacterium]